MRGPGKLPLNEYLYYRLWDPAIPEEELNRFLSFKLRGKHHWLCNARGWIGPTLDKVTWDLVLRAAGVPTPDLFAVYNTAKAAAHVRVLKDYDDICAFLRDPASYPMIAKPNFGGRSLGILAPERVEGETVHIKGGHQRSVEEVATYIRDYNKRGFLFQRLLKTDPRMEPVTGGALASCRALVLLTEDGPFLENVTLKIPRSTALADNFWRGNMMGAINRDTGHIERAISGTGFDLEVVENHPDTNTKFTEMGLPDFDAFRDFVHDIATLWPRITMQGWDIAITEHGPVPIEVNFGGDVNLQQLAHSKGALTPTYCNHLRFCGWKKPLPE